MEAPELLQDLRHAARRLTRRPALAAAAALTLALGIGANAAIFGLVEGLLLRPLPWREPDRLVMLWQTMPGNDRRWVAPANFVDWREARSFESMAALLRSERNVTGGERPTRIETASVSGGFFALLGVEPALGPGFGAAAGSERRLLVLSHGLWQSLFAGDPGCVGRTLSLDDQAWEVAGVMPPGFGFPEGVELWTLAPRDVPNPGFPGDHTAVRDSRFLDVLARLAPGVPLSAARAELDTLARRLERAHPKANADTGINAVPLHEQLVGDTRGTLALLAGVAGLVLLIACANVANLLLAEATRRRAEYAVRVALGAGRARVLRQLLAESALLAVAGALLGVLLASWTAPVLTAALPEGTPPLPETASPGLVFAFALALSLVTTLLFSIVPALSATRQSPVGGFHARGDGGGSGSGGRTRAALVVAEVALAVVLVSGAGLLARTLWNLEHADLGFDPSGVVTARVSLPGARSRPAHEVRAAYARIAERLEALPGVERAAAGVALPLTGRSPSANARAEGVVLERSGDAPDVSWRAVSPGWFEALGLRRVQGRLFDERDGAGSAPVTVINRTLADALWPGADPLGQRVGTGMDGEDVLATVIGVVADTPHDRAGGRAAPEMFRPLAQESRRAPESLRLAVRLAPSASLDAEALRRAVWEIDPEAPVTEIASLSVVAGRAAARERAVGLLLGSFAALALALACVGLYGVLSCVVGERSHEIGVRLALGAAPADVRRFVLGRGLALAGAGLTAGLALAVWTSRLLGHLLYGVEPLDPPTFAGVAVTLLAVSALASLLPAARAARVDPLASLRAD